MTRAWLIWSVGVLFYVYDFLIRVSPSLMVGELMRDFDATAASLGGLSAWYLYAYGVLQVPVGLVLDRFGARRLLIGAAVLTALGCLIFALAPGIELARLGRLLNGVGGSASFLGSLMLAVLWLPPERYAVLGGLTMGIGIFGAMLLQFPLALAVQHGGWRAAMLALAALGAAIVALLWAVVREAPSPPRHARAGTAAVLRRALANRQVWMLAVVDSAFAGPMLAWGGLWGVPYLMQAHGLGRAAAVDLNAVLLVGWGLGGPVAGWISQRCGRRKPPLVAALGAATGGWLVLALAPPLPLAGLAALYAGLGLASGAMLLGFALARELAPPETIGTAGGIMNTLMTTAGALLQPLFGWLLDRQWAGETALGARLYPAQAYAHAALVFVALQAVAFVIALRLEESYGRPRRAEA